MITVYELHGVRVLECDSGGPALRTAQDASDLIAEASGADVRLVVLPANRLAPEFFELRTGLAGEMLQKFVNYRKQLAIIGDVSAHTGESKSFRDFAVESNRGNAIWFLTSRDQLEERLQAQAES